MADASDSPGTFPCQAGSRIDFEWGLGRELLLAEALTSSAEATTDNAFGTIQWDEPSPAQRQLAYDTMKLYKTLHTQGQKGTDSSTRLDQMRHYSQDVAAVLQASCNRSAGVVDQGQQQVTEDCCAWELLHMCYLLAPRSEGIIIQDMVLWVRRHNQVLAGPNGSLQGAFNSLAAEVQEGQAAPESIQGYWPVIHRMVCLGWRDEARDLMFIHSECQDSDEQLSMAAELAARQLLEKTDALLKGMPQMQALGQQGVTSGSFASLDAYTDARQRWQGQCQELLDSPLWWEDCRAQSPDTAAGLRTALDIMAGNREALASLDLSWLELTVAMLLYGQSARAGTRQGLSVLADRCLDQREEPPQDAAGQFLTLIETLLPAAADVDTPKVLAAVAELSLWFKAHMADLLDVHSAGRSILHSPLESEGGDMAEKLTLAYAHSLMPHPTTWHVAAAYLAWCPCHGAESMQQLLSQLPIQGDERLARKVLHECQQYGLKQEALGVCRQMGVHHLHAGHNAAALSWFMRAHDEARAEAAAAPLVAQIEDMLANTAEGFQAIPALNNLEGMLTSLTPASTALSSTEENSLTGTVQKPAAVVQHKGVVGFLQAFLKLQQGLATFHNSKQAAQVQQSASLVRDVVMLLVGSKVAKRHLWLHLLFHTVPVMEAMQPPGFSVQDTQQLLTRIQEVAIWASQSQVNGKQQQVQSELMAVRLALARNLAQAHICAY